MVLLSLSADNSSNDADIVFQMSAAASIYLVSIENSTLLNSDKFGATSNFLEEKKPRTQN
jgi:hypothetical protein